jgi:short-subunit dehydrogenase
MRISGSTVLLTGASGGIGGAIARRLTAAGARLILTGRRQDLLKALAHELGAHFVVADLEDRQDLLRLTEECADVQIVVANAALPASGEILDYTPAQIDRALAVNLLAPIMLARLLTGPMVDSGRGHLVFIGSMSGKAATPSSALYTATKHGLRGFVHAFRQDLRGTGVGVSLVQPGFVSGAGMFADTGLPTPSGVRTISPDQVATAVLRAIERERAEINIAPAKLRLRCALAAQFPALAQMMAPRGGEEIARKIADAQRSSR